MASTPASSVRRRLFDALSTVDDVPAAQAAVYRPVQDAVFGELTGATGVDPVDELLGRLPDRPVTLVGNSQGGRVAIEAALEHPGRFDALFLIAPAVTAAPWDENPPDVAALEERIGKADQAGDVDEVNRLEAWFWLDGPTSAEGRVGGAVRELFLDMNGGLLRAGTEPPWRERRPAWERLPTLDLPVHVLFGDLDDVDWVTST